jgi:hypothetical protein
MNRFYQILNSVNETLAEAAQKTYKGQKRSDLKDSDFLFPETRSFPIVSPQDIADAISNFGRMKGEMTYDAFLQKLYNFAKKKGPEFVAALPDASKEKLGIKTSQADDMYGAPPMQEPKDLELENENEEQEDEDEEDPIEMEMEKIEKEIELELLKKKLIEIKKAKSQDFTQVEDMEQETVEQELMEYKNDFYQMSLGSIKSIATHAQAIVDAIESNSVKEGLTESWLQGKIAVTEDYMLTIHNFLMFGRTETDTEGKIRAQKLPGLWENIRKKKEKMGKNYRPAKPGEKDRPDPESWKKAQ